MVYAFCDHPCVTHVFIIDHKLRDGSAEEVAQAAKFAEGLGYTVITDCWAHDGVTSGIQVKARSYRYTALGRLCRAAGLTNLMTAHTADDQAETLLMRLDRQTGWRGLAGMPTCAFGPLWPALAGVTLHRPWLNVSRAELRAYNHTNELPFVDDPSNENRDFTRVRARQALAVDTDLRADLLKQQQSARMRLSAERKDHADWLAKHAHVSPHGFIEIDAVPPCELLLHLLNIVAGQGGPIDAAKRKRLHGDMSQSGFKSATLAGAWVVKTPHGFVLTRDMVAVTGRNDLAGLGRIGLIQGEKHLWDGRFWMESKQTNMTVEPAFGNLHHMKQHADLKCIFDLQKEVRPSLPLYRQGDSLLSFGAVTSKYIDAEAVTASRLQALYKGAISVPI